MGLAIRARMKRKISALAKCWGTSLQQFSARLYLSPHAIRTGQWWSIDGDKTLRLAYDLTPDSLVFDLGGYEGQWASDIFAMYGCLIHIFEPVPSYAEKISQRFARNPRIQTHPFGLAAKTGQEQISIDGVASSTFKSGGQSVTINLVRIMDFLRENNIASIDLMKINIEGAEYEILDQLIAEGYIAHIRDLQIQFHDFVPDAQARMEAIQQKLAATHQPTYQYPFVWDNWHLKEPA